MVAPLLVGLLLFLGFVRFVYPRRSLPSGPPGVVRELRYVVPRGASLGAIADDLARIGVVDSPWLFATYLRLVGAEGGLHRGRMVSLPFGSSPEQVARRLSSGLGAIVARVTLPEGYDSLDVARRLEASGLCSAADFLRVVRDPAVIRALGVEGPSLEGYLFPDTYELRDDQTPQQLATQLVENYRRRTAPLFARHAAALAALRSELGFGEREVLILASIVEKEAAVADERARIAGVFLNRLRSETFLPRQRLQSDPTVSYGCRAEPEASPSCAGFDGRITRAMLDESANRYNTYRVAGLPPGPISNPGLASIEAVLAPERHDFYYFVARGGRRHSFSRTLDAHNSAVDDARDRGALP